MAPDPAHTVLCVPTQLELDALRRVAPGALQEGRWRAVELVGFGPVAAAARGAWLTREHEGAPLVLVGIAGRYAGGPAVGEATSFSRVRLDGVGAQEGEGLLLPGALGFPQLGPAGTRPAVFEELPLEAPSGAPALLTVCAAAGGLTEARARAERHPGTVAEDMEAFGLAMGAQLGGAPVEVIRGISNEAGNRDPATWRIDDALAAAAFALDARYGSAG